MEFLYLYRRFGREAIKSGFRRGFIDLRQVWILLIRVLEYPIRLRRRGSFCSRFFYSSYFWDTTLG